MWLPLTLLWVVALSNCDDGDWKQVHTAQGDVRGRKDPDGGLYVFYNIPYASVPIGYGKFTAPLPPRVWMNPLEAIDRGIICVQAVTPFIDLKNKIMQEDCLVANVYVPDTYYKNLPVIVYIHGGAFEVGYGNLITPKDLVKDKKVIVVTFNYRLGVHGFLCLGTKDIPGNAGLKDQVALLRWVKKNIANFGGNPDDVTIAGYSAGSVSAHLMMLSKSTEGLFNKVILESGASVGSIAVQIDPLENAKDYAKLFNFTYVDDFYALEHYFKDTPLKSILRNSMFLRKDASVLFTPCVERQKGKSVFLDDSPVNIIKKGEYKKVPLLIGISNMEGLLQMGIFEHWKNPMNEKFSDFLPGDLKFDNEEERQNISIKVKEFYFGDKLIGEETVLSYVDYYSDLLFAYPTLRSVKLHAESGHDQIYLYEFSFVDDNTPVVPFTKVRGAGHCAQTGAVLDGAGLASSSQSQLSEEYKKIKATMRELWYNFAVHGKPVPVRSWLPAWPASRANGGPYMSLGQTVELGGVLLEARARFWDDLYERYYRQPIPPPKSGRHTEL